MSPKIPKSSIQRSASPALPPPLLPSPRLRLLFPGRPPGPTEPSASAAFSPPPAPPARPALASRSPPPAAVCLLSLLLLFFLLLTLLVAPPLTAGGSGAASPLLPPPLLCSFLLLLLLLKRSLWPQIATRLPPSAPSSPSLLPPKSEAQARGNQKLRLAKDGEGRRGEGVRRRLQTGLGRVKGQEVGWPVQPCSWTWREPGGYGWRPGSLLGKLNEKA